MSGFLHASSLCQLIHGVFCLGSGQCACHAKCVDVLVVGVSTDIVEVGKALVAQKPEFGGAVGPVH